MNPTFIDLNKKRYDWAFQAKKEFINRFVILETEKIDEASNKEITIAVYGPTQVGKTSVILSLLGIKQDKMKNLSKWLRGKRRLGVSSTVTVTRYEQSKDSYFHIFLPNGHRIREIQGSQLEAELYSIRQGIEKGNNFLVEPIVIQIPVEYFEERDSRFHILDLPGIESAELREVSHINSCINHWLPLCEVCLLVEDASQLTAFTQYTSHAVENWHDHLENFRIIPTRSLSLDSIRKKIKKEQLSTKEELIEDYAKILNQLLETELDLVDTVYPLDIGDSREELKNTDRDMFEKTSVMMQQIVNKLKMDLEMLDINELSFKRLTRLYSEAEKRSDKDLAKNKLQIDRLKNTIDISKKLLVQEEKDYERNRKISSDKVKKMENLVNQFNYQISKLESFNFSKLADESYPRNIDRPRVNEINSYGITFQNKVEDLLNEQNQELLKQALTLGLMRIGEWKTVDWFPLMVTDKKLNVFLTKKSSQKVLSNMRTEAADEGLRVCQTYIKKLNIFFERAKKQLENQKNIQYLSQFEFKKESNNTKKRIATYESNLKKNIDQYTLVVEMWERDCKHASQLMTYFIKHWLVYKKELQSTLYNGTYEERWYASYFLQLLYRDGQLIINSLTSER